MLVALTQREKFEWILQKCTELGVTSFLPVITSRCLVHTQDETGRKTERWRTILREASEQCERSRIPELLPVQSLEKALSQATSRNNETPARAFILSEHEQQQSLRTALNQIEKQGVNKNIQLLIGPEGGFTRSELIMAVNAGFLPVSLGPRILRMETAAVAASALVLYELGGLEEKPQLRE